MVNALEHLRWRCGPYTVTLRPLLAGAGAQLVYHVPDLPRLLDDPGAPVYVLREWTDYVAVVSPDPSVPPPEALYAGDVEAPFVGVGGYRIHYANRVGRSFIRLVTGGREAGAPLAVEVVTPKLSLDPGDAGRWFFYPRFLRALVDGIAAAAATWPFDYRSPTAFTTRVAEGRPAALFYFHYLRRYGRQLAAAFRAIANKPHRVLTHEHAVVPVARAHRLDAQAVTWLAAHPDAWQAVSASPAVIPATGAPPAAAPVETAAAAGGARYIPLRVLQALPEETHDNPENRFVRHFARLLRDAMRVVSPFVQRMDGAPPPGNGIAELRQALAAVEQASWWPEIGTMDVLPTSSHVLLKGAGYRDLYRLYPLFLLARLPFAGDLGEAIANRDVAALYEWWCLLKLVGELGRICGPPEGAPSFPGREGREDREGGPGALAIRFQDGTRLYFQRRCTGGRASYSLTVQPDFLIEHPRRGRICLDAKFRFELRGGSVGPEEEADPERNPTHRDLMTAHAYRDSLRCRAAVILYPGDHGVFFGVDGSRRNGLTLTELLADGALEGVGAIPFRPDEQEAGN